MNIFFLSWNIKKCCKYYCNSHVVKIPLEIAQMLCTALILCNQPAVYKMAHKNHPMTIWVRNNRSNFRWTRKFGLQLCAEYTHRYGKTHKCEEIMRKMKTPKALKKADLTEPPQCMPEECKMEGNVVLAYRNYYVMKKTHLFFKKNGNHCWTNREMPRFVQEVLELDDPSKPVKLEKPVDLV